MRSSVAVPPAFPRIPLLIGHPHTHDDRVVDEPTRHRLLTEPVVVEEKLDGANLSFWLGADGWPCVASRSGKTSGDRGGQLGLARAWLNERAQQVAALLTAGEVLYCEWLRRTHTVEYQALPDYAVALDLWHPDHGFSRADTRDARCAAVNISTPPRLHEGPLGGMSGLARLHSRARFGDHLAEGLMIRLEGPESLLLRAKWLAPTFKRKSDEAWRTDTRTNKVVGQPRTWAPGGE